MISRLGYFSEELRHAEQIPTALGLIISYSDP